MKQIEKEQNIVAESVVQNSSDLHDDDILDISLGETNLFNEEQDSAYESPPMNGESFSVNSNRSLWKRPCFDSCETVVISDSIGSFLSDEIIPNGTKFYSFSGLDMAELNILLSNGSIPQIATRYGNQSFLIEKNARHLFSTSLVRKPFYGLCSFCQKECLPAFSGKLVICVSINNFLKNHQKSFDGQSAPILFENIERNCQINFPFVRLIFGLPVKPSVRKMDELQKSKSFFDELVSQILEREYVGSIQFGQKYHYHLADGIHLSPEGKRHYWKYIFSSIKNM